jgi:hypothetical protein
MGYAEAVARALRTHGYSPSGTERARVGVLKAPPPLSDG